MSTTAIPAFPTSPGSEPADEPNVQTGDARAGGGGGKLGGGGGAVPRRRRQRQQGRAGPSRRDRQPARHGGDRRDRPLRAGGTGADRPRRNVDGGDRGGVGREEPAVGVRARRPGPAARDVRRFQQRLRDPRRHRRLQHRRTQAGQGRRRPRPSARLSRGQRPRRGFQVRRPGGQERHRLRSLQADHRIVRHPRGDDRGHRQGVAGPGEDPHGPRLRLLRRHRGPGDDRRAANPLRGFGRQPSPHRHRRDFQGRRGCRRRWCGDRGPRRGTGAFGRVPVRGLA